MPRIEVVREEHENLADLMHDHIRSLYPKPPKPHEIQAPFTTRNGEPAFYRPGIHRSRLQVPPSTPREVVLKDLLIDTTLVCESERQAAEEGRRHGKKITHGPGSQYF